MDEADEIAIRAEAEARIKELKEQEAEARRRHFAFIEPMSKKFQ